MDNEDGSSGCALLVIGKYSESLRKNETRVTMVKCYNGVVQWYNTANKCATARQLPDAEKAVAGGSGDFDPPLKANGPVEKDIYVTSSGKVLSPAVAHPNKTTIRVGGTL